MGIEDEFVDDDAFEMFRDHARSYVEWQFGEFDEMNDDLHATAMVETPDRMGLIPVGHLFGSEDAKEMVAELLPQIVAEMGALRYAFVSSTWQIASSTNGATDDEFGTSYEEFVRWREENPDLSLGAHPEAYEAIVCISGDWTGAVVMEEAKISRHDDAPPTLSPWETRAAFKWSPREDCDKQPAYARGRFIDPVMAELTGTRKRVQDALHGAIDQIDADGLTGDMEQAIIQAAREVFGVEITDPRQLPEPDEVGLDNAKAFVTRVSEIFRERHPEVVDGLMEAIATATDNIA